MDKAPKIALVKQEVYQDLYVCPVTEKDPATILFSSMGRVGPIGLTADLGADFYIVKEEPQWETHIYRKVTPHIAKYLSMLKTQTLDKLPGQAFKRPGSPYPNGRFAVDGRSIDWGQYDIVISINVSLPAEVVLQYPRTLFAYMIGEANMATGAVHFGYDVTLNQMARGIVATQCGRVDFPYTFVGGDTLERIMSRYLQRPSQQKGVFMEINSTTERPVTQAPPHFRPLKEAGYDIILHQQRICDNLKNIYDAKYFVKMGGRTIRGNSVAEVVSLGTLAIMDRNEVIHKELIIDECHVTSMEEMTALINRLEKDPARYQALLAKQRAVLQDLFFDRPLQSLLNCLQDKRQKSRPHSYTLWDKLYDRQCLLPLKCL
ncbi:MAG: hypothetical protein LUC45_02255 [Paraprevotella sp.]|nr:hypothetical protein [Paraprevotella sp.]